MRKQLLAIAGLGLGVVIGTGGLLSAQNGRGDAPTAEASTVREERVYLVDTPHWTNEHLESLKAEEDPEASIYLSAVQLVQLKRDEGNLREAVDTLQKLAPRTPTQPLKSALRRLLVEIHLEMGDTLEAEQELEKIINENLLQL